MKEEKSDYINYRISRAHSTFADAVILAESGCWNSCVNRLYYSCFYMVNALLFKFQIEAKTHSGIRSRFFYEFIKTGKLTKELGKLYSDLFDWRNEGDYADFIEFDKDFTEPVVAKVKIFIETLEEMIREHQAH